MPSGRSFRFIFAGIGGNGRQRFIVVQGHVRHAIGANPAAVHAFGVEGRGNGAISTQHDRPTIAAQLGDDLIDDGLTGLMRGFIQVSHARANVMGRHGTDVELTPAGPGYRAGCIGIGASTDDGESPTRP